MSQSDILSIISVIGMLGGIPLGMVTAINCDGRGLSGGKTATAVALVGLMWAGLVFIVSVGITH